MTTNFDEEQTEGVEPAILSQIAKRYLPFWPLFLLLAIGGLAIAYVFLLKTNPVYQVSAKLLVKDPKKGLDGSNVLEALNVFGEKKIVENETEILRSWPLVKEVINRLNLYTSQFKKEQLRKEELYGEDAPLQIIALNKDSINGSKIPLEVFIDWKKSTFIIAAKSHHFGDTILLNRTKFIISANPIAAIGTNQQPIHIWLQINDVSTLSEKFIEAVTVAPTSKQSTVIEVGIQTTVPDKGIDLINTLFKVYNEASITDKNLIAKSTLNFVNDRLGIVTKELENVEENIKAYKTREGIVDMSEQGKLFLTSVKENDQKISEINIQLSVLYDVEMYITGKGANPGTVPSLMGINDVTLVQLLTKLYENEMLLSRLVKISGTQNVQQEQLRDEIAHLKPGILENIRNIRNNFTTIKNKLQETITRSNGMLTLIPGKEKALIDISRQQVIKNSIYSFLLQKREESELSFSSAVADSRVVEPATASVEAIKPKPAMIYLIALAMGIGLGVLFVLFKENYNQKVMFRTEIEHQVKVPILGELMFDKKKDSLVVKDGSRTLLAEQFRMLRTNLKFLSLGAKNRVIQVSSSISGEGKSYVASNLAIALSLTGKSVVLMELDLRKPKISEVFNLEKEIGITEYLVGMKTLEQIIKPIAAYKGLNIISSGVIPPNPSELIGSQNFSDLIDILKSRFDYIVFDTAPVSLVSDALLLAPFADATIYVLRHEYTPKAYLNFIQQLNKDKKFNNLCLVFNGVKPRGFNVYGYGYGYGHAYGAANGKGYYGEETKKATV